MSKGLVGVCRQLASSSWQSTRLMATSVTDSWKGPPDHQSYAADSPRQTQNQMGVRGINRVELYGYISGVYQYLTANNNDSINIQLIIPGDPYQTADGWKQKQNTCVNVRSFKRAHSDMHKNGALNKGDRLLVIGSLFSIAYEKGSIDPATNAQLQQNTRRLFVNADRLISIPKQGKTDMSAWDTEAVNVPDANVFDADYDDATHK